VPPLPPAVPHSGNPFYQQATGQPIADAIARLLSRGDGRGEPDPVHLGAPAYLGHTATLFP